MQHMTIEILNIFWKNNTCSGPKSENDKTICAAASRRSRSVKLDREKHLKGTFVAVLNNRSLSLEDSFGQVDARAPNPDMNV